MFLCAVFRAPKSAHGHIRNDTHHRLIGLTAVLGKVAGHMQTDIDIFTYHPYAIKWLENKPLLHALTRSSAGAEALEGTK